MLVLKLLNSTDATLDLHDVSQKQLVHEMLEANGSKRKSRGRRKLLEEQPTPDRVEEFNLRSARRDRSDQLRQFVLPLASLHKRAGRESVRRRDLLPVHTDPVHLSHVPASSPFHDENIPPEHFQAWGYRDRLYPQQLVFGFDYKQGAYLYSVFADRPCLWCKYHYKCFLFLPIFIFLNFRLNLDLYR